MNGPALLIADSPAHFNVLGKNYEFRALREKIYGSFGGWTRRLTLRFRSPRSNDVAVAPTGSREFK